MSEIVMSGLRKNISMSSGNVLVIEDEDKVRSLLNRIVSMEGYVVYEAPDLKTAEKILRKEEIDVVVSDVRLPDGSGLDFIRKVKRCYPEVEIVLLTAHAAISDGVEAIRSGAFNYISKGSDNDKLLPLIAEAMEKTLLKKRREKWKRGSFMNSALSGSSDSLLFFAILCRWPGRSPFAIPPFCSWGRRVPARNYLPGPFMRMAAGRGFLLLRLIVAHCPGISLKANYSGTRQVPLRGQPEKSAD
jgi:ActR/RegA family two-component response regulator